jgi:hypothetical protein
MIDRLDAWIRAQGMARRDLFEWGREMERARLLKEIRQRIAYLDEIQGLNATSAAAELWRMWDLLDSPPPADV